jgi:hypothetical protein
MKIVLSRKGFDSAAGGVASPILADCRMYSLPIPDKTSPVRYEDISPHGRLVPHLTRGKVKATYGAHLDPDLVAGSIHRQPGWKPIFGQADTDQRVLEREGVGPGDLFLFFGWFRQVEQRDGVFRYVPGAPDLHVLWGWLQIGMVLRVGIDPIPGWAARHPHVAQPEGRRFNTLYNAADRFTLDGGATDVPGAGVFGRYDDRLRLTAPGRSRSIWSLPGWFHPADGRTPLGYHGDLRRWSWDGDRAMLQTVGRGQEFVLDGDQHPEVIGWVRGLMFGTWRS